MALDDRPLRIVTEASSKELTSLELLPAFERKTSTFSDRWSGKVAGVAPPRWWAPDLTIPGNPLTLFSTDEAFYVPSMGAVISSSGEAFSIPLFQSTYLDPKSEKLAQFWERRASAPRIDAGIVSVPWGALHNYGHFVLDALTSVAAIARREEFGKTPFVAPPLRDWQRQHFKLLNIEPLELTEPIYALGRVSFASGIRGSLHNPNLHFLTLRSAQLANLPSAIAKPPRIYISRQGQKRPMVNEAELETALKKVGFVVIKPETMPVSEQITTFNSAEVIVAPTGAALANLLYAKKATVFEIIPRDMTLSDTAHKWVAYLTAMGGGDWRPYFCEDAPNVEQPEMAGSKRPGYLPFSVPVADLVSFISCVL